MITDSVDKKEQKWMGKQSKRVAVEKNLTEKKKEKEKKERQYLQERERETREEIEEFKK